MPAPPIFWMTAFLDTALEYAEACETFWAEVTGHRISARRGAHGEFASLLPPEGDPHLKVQRVEQSPASTVHLDLHTEDVGAAARAVEELGGSTRPAQGYVVCRSPGGLVFCLVDHPASQVAPPAQWPSGRSRVDQVRFDIPPRVWENETRFWAGLTGWDLVDEDSHDEFMRLRWQPGVPLQVLLQRLDEDQPVVTVHLDLGTDDYLAEAQRHVELGAVEVKRTPHWVVLKDPSGRTYCATRHPVDRPAV